MRSYYVLRKEHTAFQLKNLIPSVKHGGGSIMAWACFAASWPGQAAIIDGTINSELYQKILKEYVRTWTWNVIERVSCSKTTTPSTQVILPKKNKVNVLERLSQSPDLNPIKMLWKDLSKQFIRSFFSINIWQRKYFSLICLIQFSLSTFRTYMKILWCFGSYLWHMAL